jgi:hypothetical protein
LGVASAKHKFLRHKLAYKQIWWYYAAMVIDPILRFNWIFYIIYRNDLQTTSIVAFFVAFSEVCRRGMWTLFRVENEHCNNVGRFRASRDVPLPYEIENDSNQELLGKASGEEDRPQTTDAASTPPPPPLSEYTQAPHDLPSERLSPEVTRTSATDIEQGHGPSSAASLRRRRPSLTNSPMARAIRLVGNTMRAAHAQDYERKRKPELGNNDADAGGDDDDDDDDDEQSSDSDDDSGRQQPRGARNHVARERRDSSEEDGRRDLEEAEDLVARAGG